MSKLKNIVRRIVPQPMRSRLKMLLFGPLQELRLIRAFATDYSRYRKYSYCSYRKNDGVENLSAMIIMEAHCIEKAFSLPDIRSGYGCARIRSLIKLLKKYRQCGYDEAGLAFQKAQSVLAEYIRYHDKVGHDLGDFKEEVLPWVDMECNIGGYTQLTRSELSQSAGGNFKECALSRSSIRNYAPNPVPDATIREVVEIARKTPSVCNRQAWHTYIVKDPKLKDEVLELQSGSRGFGDQSDFLVIITTDMASFVGPGERNESYVDGGLYAMSILYALHYKGVGACPLHWMVEPPKERKLRELLEIKPSENVILMITAGGIPETVRVAKSVRKEVDDILTIINPDHGKND